MRISKPPFGLMLLMITVFQANLKAESGVVSDILTFAEEETTTYYRAVFAQYLTVIPDKDLDDGNQSVDCALSISNLCAAPSAVSPLLGSQKGPTSGKVTLVLYGADGEVIIYTPNSDSVGEGLNPDGTLSEGRTWRVILAEILADHEGRSDLTGVTFSGYGWILSEFDCLGGTYNNTVFGVGFTQAFECLPAMGQGGWFGGVPIFGLKDVQLEEFLKRRWVP
jgi:hypothetical protein